MDSSANISDKQPVQTPEPTVLVPEFKPLTCTGGPFKPGSKECQGPVLNLSPLSDLERAVIDRAVKDLPIISTEEAKNFKLTTPLDFSNSPNILPTPGRVTDNRLNLDMGPRAPQPGEDLRLKLDRIITFDLNMQGQPVEIGLNPRKCNLKARTGLCVRMKF